LLTHISQDDIKHLQSVGKDAQAARKQFILKDDQAEVWKHVQSLRDARIDFVLDNGKMVIVRFPVTSNQRHLQLASRLFALLSNSFTANVE